MPAQHFTVHVDPDDLARQDLAVAIPLPTLPDAGSAAASGSAAAEKHGAHDERLAARLRSERDRAGRAAGPGSGRSYAFRRS